MTSTYNIAFPALLYPGLGSQKIKTNTSSPPHWSLAPPKYPSYLKLTLYGNLVTEQYNLMQHVQKTTQESTTAVKDKQEHDLANLDLRLPTFWNSKDKSKNIDVGRPGKQETHAALARSNFPMRPQCGIFYYEMKVISKGEDGYIGIGFCCAENKTERLPGWDVDSWGYHGDDGHSFAGSGIGQNYGPCFTTGDVIGCGVNFADRSAFYTKNGKFLGTAFRQIDVSKPLYPSVGLRTTGEKITTNFGHEPFMFDIEQYIKDQKVLSIQQMTSRQSIDRTPYTEYDLNQLVLSYLIHHGYTKTAFAFVKNTKSISDTDQEDTVTVRGTGMEQRTAIRSAIIRGDIDDAIRLIQQYFPKLLDQGERGKSVQLMLKCGKFVEMMREYCEHTHKKNGKSPFECNELGEMPKPSKQKRRLSYAEIASSINQKKDVNLESSKHTKHEHSENQAHMMDIDEKSEKDVSAESLERVMKYGQQLQEEYKLDHSEKTKASLTEIFSLLAYHDPYTSPVSHIMSVSRRDALATEVNAAILAFLQQPEIPALERIYRQLILSNKMLSIEGDGTSALVKVEDYYMNHMEKIKMP
ncbi:hypothetical protein RMATCC62417_18001 [Rhizopus microsporus]|nr:hypothetical protein RMATCC62417_18001 [Rhizopus microsporus]